MCVTWVPCELFEPFSANSSNFGTHFSCVCSSSCVVILDLALVTLWDSCLCVLTWLRHFFLVLEPLRFIFHIFLLYILLLLTTLSLVRLLKTLIIGLNWYWLEDFSDKKGVTFDSSSVFCVSNKSLSRNRKEAWGS